MNSKEILTELKRLSSDKYKANVVRMGIPEELCIGVSTGDVRKLAKRIGKSNELAFELWNTGCHEARILATFVFEKKAVTHQDIEKLMKDVVSWDLCDYLCRNVILKMKDFEEFIYQWISSPFLYEKRAAFVLISSSVIHDKNITEDTLDAYLKLIYENSQDEQDHAKKAASCALKEIGKKNFNYNEKALIVAHELMQTGNKAQIWIARDAGKELEHLVPAEGRTRLISVKTQMGKYGQ